jgi:hypothetical protein
VTVLILATEHDISADRMVRTLANRGVPVFRADLSWFPSGSVSTPNSGTAGGRAGWRRHTAK